MYRFQARGAGDDLSTRVGRHFISASASTGEPGTLVIAQTSRAPLWRASSRLNVRRSAGGGDADQHVRVGQLPCPLSRRTRSESCPPRPRVLRSAPRRRRLSRRRACPQHRRWRAFARVQYAEPSGRTRADIVQMSAAGKALRYFIDRLRDLWQHLATASKARRLFAVHKRHHFKCRRSESMWVVFGFLRSRVDFFVSTIKIIL